MSLYPAFLDLKGKKCIVVGGGRVAQRKVGPLLRAGALVWVYSPRLTPVLSRLNENGLIRHFPRGCGKNELKGAFLVFSATDSHAENEKIASLAHGLGIPVNVASGEARSSFIVPSVVRRGPLMIAVSTSGASPAMSKSIRLEIRKFYGTQFSGYLKGLSRLRQKALKDKDLSPASRKRLFKRLASFDIIKRIRAGEISSPEDAL
ncbi:MAG: bifunctional precorrin-2 dehydrogenase/sirohydrochlorin ferrochelatase [Nitrospiraceae bacterium]|nr:bifunctional precorrin-2 dehydrogenase/sirohydrochlorin ferrochelatase [Nitrospiraceae bacterium]